MTLAVVRDLREHRAPATDEELADAPDGQTAGLTCIPADPMVRPGRGWGVIGIGPKELIKNAR